MKNNRPAPLGATGWGWGAALLPYIEQGNLHAAYVHYDLPVCHADNSTALGMPLRLFRCPSDIIRIDKVTNLDVLNIHRDILYENAIIVVFCTDNNLRAFRKTTGRHAIFSLLQMRGNIINLFDGLFGSGTCPSSLIGLSQRTVSHHDAVLAELLAELEFD